MKESWVEKIYTKNGKPKENILDGAKALDIGCGQRKLTGSTGMDVVESSQADVVHDASVIPFPFEDNSFDLVFTNHFLEHTKDPLAFLDEVHRILKPKGRFVAQVPYFRHSDAFGDITHRQFFTSITLDYVINGTKVSNYHYSERMFNKIGFWYGWPTKSSNPLVNLFKKYITKHSKFYDRYLSLLFPVPCLTWELEAVKDSK